MKTALLICVMMAAALLLNGCVIFSFEESGRTKRVCAVCSPSQGIIRVVHVSCPPSQPQRDPLIE